MKATSVALAMTAVCLGPATASTLAASARISTDKQTGEVRLVYGEVRDATGQFPQEVNTVRITLTTAGYTVTDTTAPVLAGVKCVSAGVHSATCSAAGVTMLFVDGGELNDAIVNDTTTPSRLLGGPGDDTVVGGDGPDTITSNPGRDTIDARGGDDNINTAGQDADKVSCGTGNDHLVFDKFDTIAADCETAPPGTPGGPTTGPLPVPPLPPGTPLPPLPPLPPGVPASIKSGSCATNFIGTASLDRIDGSAGGDREFGLAGNDVLLSDDGTKNTVRGGIGTDTGDVDDLDDVLAVESVS